jgi:hypothetical protein
MEPTQQPPAPPPETPPIASAPTPVAVPVSPVKATPGPLSLIKLPNSITKALVLMTVGGILAALVIPRLDQALGGTAAAAPTLISLGGMAVVTILLTGMVLKAAERAGVGLSSNWLSLALTYNALIVVVKFMLAPAALYKANQSTDFTANFLGGDANNIQYYLLVAGAIGLLYIAAFWLINWLLLRRKAKLSPLGRKSITSTLAIIAAIVVFGIVTGGMVVIVPLLLAANSLQYLGFIFGTAAAYAIIAALAAAAVVAVMAVRQTAGDQAASGHSISTATFFTLGVTLIVLYHFLWIVYMMSLVTIWPFKTYTPK